MDDKFYPVSADATRNFSWRTHSTQRYLYENCVQSKRARTMCTMCGKCKDVGAIYLNLSFYILCLRCGHFLLLGGAARKKHIRNIFNKSFMRVFVCCGNVNFPTQFCCVEAFFHFLCRNHLIALKKIVECFPLVFPRNLHTFFATRWHFAYKFVIACRVVYFTASTTGMLGGGCEATRISFLKSCDVMKNFV